MTVMNWGLLSVRSGMISEQIARLLKLTTLSLGLVIAVVIGGGVVEEFALSKERRLFELKDDAGALKAALLQMRRNEKDFLERKTKDELTKHAQNYETANKHLDLLLKNAEANAGELETVNGLKNDIAGYRKTFLAAADEQIALGVDENSGLQGVMRKSVREFEDVAKKLGSDEILVGVLTLRRHEKDFILRERDEYVTRHAQETNELRGILRAVKVDAAAGQRMAETLTSYEKSFKDFVAGTFAVNAAVKAGRALARAAEEPLDPFVAKVRERASTAAKQAERTALIATAVVTLLGLAALVLLWRTLSTMRRAITSSVETLRSAIESVRDGSGLGALAQLKSKDELAELGFGVNQLLQDQISGREQAEEERKKAEDENERLNNSVISILQAVNLLSQRDLTARAPVTQDIIGTVSDSINALTDETSRVLAGVSLIAAQVAVASGKVKSQGDLVSRTAEDERLNVGRMISSLTASTQTTNQMATLAEQSNHSAEQATMATDNALETVNGTVKGMESIRETIAETEKRIKRLGERAQEITGIVSLINTISERTHVLALNASMQAAVAGEAGRGFAVVAEEVQRLAESSRNATHQIGTLVSNIQLETNETINTVNRTIDQVVKGSEQAQKAGKEMRRTQEVTAQLVSQVKRIAEGSELQKEMSANLLASVHEMSKSNERTAAQIGTQNVETESLQASARRLVDSVNVFKLPQAA